MKDAPPGFPGAKPRGNAGSHLSPLRGSVQEQRRLPEAYASGYDLSALRAWGTAAGFACGILNHRDFAIGTSKLEGVHNKIKLIERRAYGFADPDYSALKVKQAFPGKETGNFLG